MCNTYFYWKTSSSIVIPSEIVNMSFWEKKMRVYFKRIDFDHDGVITRKDFEGMADRFIKTGKFDDAKAKDLTGTLLAVSYYFKNMWILRKGKEYECRLCILNFRSKVIIWSSNQTFMMTFIIISCDIACLRVILA